MTEPTSTPKGLTMTRDENYEAIMAAWMNPGPQPAYHRAMQAEVHRTMPVLAAALERAALDATRPTTGEEGTA